MEKPHVGIAKYYIGSLNGGLETVGVRSGKTMGAQVVLTPAPDDAPTPTDRHDGQGRISQVRLLST